MIPRNTIERCYQIIFLLILSLRHDKGKYQVCWSTHLMSRLSLPSKLLLWHVGRLYHALFQIDPWTAHSLSSTFNKNSKILNDYYPFISNHL